VGGYGVLGSRGLYYLSGDRWTDQSMVYVTPSALGRVASVTKSDAAKSDRRLLRCLCLALLDCHIDVTYDEVIT
jgi:hypothetical protein